MKAHFEWATLNRLLDQAFFCRTMDLYELEEKVKTPIHDSLHWSRRFEYPWAMSGVLDQPERMKSVLDVGAGATALQFVLSDLGYTVTMIDPDRSAVNWTKRTAWPSTSDPRQVVNFAYEGKLPELPFREQEFDATICISVLEHLPKDQVLPSIRELLRVTRKSTVITMDVCLEKHSTQTDIFDFQKLLTDLNVYPQNPPPPLALTFFIAGHNFAVACLHLQQ